MNMLKSFPISFKNIGGAILLAVVFCFCLLLIVVNADNLTRGFRARSARKAANELLIRQAAELGLTYDSVVSNPAGAVGQPALWCLRKVAAQEMLYQGKEDKPVYITNPQRMRQNPLMHKTCIDTLVTIRKLTLFDYSGARGFRLEAEFVDFP